MPNKENLQSRVEEIKSYYRTSIDRGRKNTMEGSVLALGSAIVLVVASVAAKSIPEFRQLEHSFEAGGLVGAILGTCKVLLGSEMSIVGETTQTAEVISYLKNNWRN